MRWLLLVTLLAACTAPAAPELPEPTATRTGALEWRASLTQEMYEVGPPQVHYLAAHDGTQLSLTLYLPEGPTSVPTLLQLTPYQAGRSHGLLGTGSASPSWLTVAARGAAYVEADARGTNASGGCLDFGGALDREDARSFIAWIREQPWSNGIVVTDGVSHPGMGSIVAHAAEPTLNGAIAVAPVVSYYQDEWIQGARFEDQLNGAGYESIEAEPARYDDPRALQAQAAECSGETLLDFNKPTGAFDEQWQDRDLALTLEEALAGGVTPAPILLAHGFTDVNVHPDHSQLYWDALPDDHPKFAIFGWWYHRWPNMEGHPAHRYDEVRQRWFDATLFGIDNGALLEPRVVVEDSQGGWHESHDWPLDGSEEMVLWPSGGALVAKAPAAGDHAYQDLPDERNRWQNAVRFVGETLDEDTLITGAPEVQLVATATQETNWVVWLLDVHPDGSLHRITHGLADSHMVEPRAAWVGAAGARATWTIPLWPTATVVEEGHSIMLLVTSQDSRRTAVQGSACLDDHNGGCYQPSGIRPAASLGIGTNTVHTGPDGTLVRFAAVDPGTTSKPVWPEGSGPQP